MKSSGRGYLVDTNVLVYVYDPSDGRKRARAASVTERLAATKSAAVSAQVLGEFLVTVTRKIPRPLTIAEAERSLTAYARSWPVYGLTADIVLEAVRGVERYQFSYWDALIWATAKLNGVPNILSEDFSHGRLIEGVRFLNPFMGAFDLTRLTVT